jgi:peptidyl-dipeptidase Dcp
VTIIDPTAFERETLNKLNMPEEIVMRHRIPEFGHIFQAMDMPQVTACHLWLMWISTDAFRLLPKETDLTKKSRRG